MGILSYILGGIGGILIFIFAFTLTYRAGTGNGIPWRLIFANIGLVLVFIAVIINKRYRRK